jgi:hypothetical protein
VTVTPKGSLTEILQSQPTWSIYALPGVVLTLAGLHVSSLLIVVVDTSLHDLGIL